MKSRAEKLMNFLETEHLITIDEEHESWRWSFLRADMETKLNEFLKKQEDPRLRDAKDEVESLRMELRETRKELEKAHDDFTELQWDG